MENMLSDQTFIKKLNKNNPLIALSIVYHVSLGKDKMSYLHLLYIIPYMPNVKIKSTMPYLTNNIHKMRVKYYHPHTHHTHQI